MVALVGALTLLAVSAAVVVRNARARTAAALDERLSAAASIHREALDAHFARTREIALLVARNPAFAPLGAADRGGDRRATGPDIDGATAALAYLQRLYPGQIREAGVIDAHGAEIARVVNGRAIPASDLGGRRARGDVARATLALPAGGVRQARPMRSADTGDRVVTTATAVPSPDGVTRAIVHFGVTLDSFRATMRAVDPGLVVRVVDSDGAVVLDSRSSAAGEAVPGAAPITPFSSGAGVAGIRDGDGQRTAYQAVTAGAANANRWFVTVSAPVAGLALTDIGWDALLLIVAGVLLLGLAAWGFRAYQRELRTAAMTDALSGLPNRALFYDRTTQALAGAGRDGLHTAVLLLDVDRFKDVNDALGHHVGDILLQDVAARLDGAVRDCDTVARLGGDEFALLFTRLDDPDQALQASRRVLACLEPAFSVGGVPLSVDASVGVAIGPGDGTDVDTLLKHADIAMYVAKRTGMAVTAYAPELDTSDPQRLQLVGELRVAIDAGQLDLEYQPKIDLATGALDGVEALVRWDHPRLGRLAATEFIGLAEDTGLIRALTARVVDIGLAQCRAWLDDGREIQVAVNLSARCAQDLGTVEVARDALARWEVPAHLLKFEITETSLVGDRTRALEVLTRLSELGVTLSIDDYGTGYSSLAYLKELPIHEIKIDRMFMRDLGETGADASIVRSTVDLGHSLGLRVVAEGVEDDRSVTELVAFGCDTAQGYFFSVPLTAASLSAWLLDRDLDALAADDRPGSGTDSSPALAKTPPG